MSTLATGTARALSYLTAEACEQGSDSPSALDHCRCPCGGSRHAWGRDLADVPPGDPHHVPAWQAPERVGRYREAGRRCSWCHRPMTASSRARTCSPACRQGAYRERRQGA
ncbi:MAG: hypothetical protein M0005_10420 [Actinomycetota bacterium]|nr:hypothetical protein [Actinomycetota bacterium]MDA8301936.1 hypothetical protein [Actinomycetota bacterium]